MKPALQVGLMPLLITLGIQALVSMASLTPPVLAPAAAAEIGVPASLIGLFVGLVYIGSMLSSLGSGDLIGRFGAIRISQACLILCAAGLALATVGVPAAIVLSALLIGFGYGPVTPASSHILARTTPANRMGFVFSLKQTGVPLGGMLAGALVPTMVLLAGWRGAALAVALFCVVMAVLTQPIRAALDDDRDAHRRISLSGVLGPLRMVFAYKAVRDLAICSFFFGAMQLCLTTFLVTYLTEEFGLRLVAAGLVLSVAQAAGIFGRLLWGWVADHWIASRILLGLLAVGMASCALLLAVYAHGWPFAWVLVLCAAFGGTAIGWNGVYLAEIARLAPAGQTGAMTGGALFITYSGVVAGPPLFAGIVSMTGEHASGFLAFGLIVMLIGMSLVLTRAQRTDPEADRQARRRINQ